MLISLLASIAVLGFTVVCAWLNWLHMAKYGTAVAALVIFAELLKAACPLALEQHAQQRRVGSWLATALIFACLATFSVLNSFSAVISRQAEAQARKKDDNATITRAEHVVRAEIAKLAACRPIVTREIVTNQRGQNTGMYREVSMPNTACETSRASKIAAFESEIAENAKRASVGRDLKVDENVVPDGIRNIVYVLLGIKVSRWDVETLMTLAMVLMCEIGSCFGALIIPRDKLKRKKSDIQTA